MLANVQVNEEPKDLREGIFARKEQVAFSSCYSDTFWPFHSESAEVVMDQVGENRQG